MLYCYNYSAQLAKCQQKNLDHYSGNSLKGVGDEVVTLPE